MCVVRQRYVGARRSVVVGAAKKSAKEADEDDEYEEIEVEEEVEEEVMVRIWGFRFCNVH